MADDLTTQEGLRKRMGNGGSYYRRFKLGDQNEARANPHLQICRYLLPTVGWQSWFCEMRSTSEPLSPKLFGDCVTIRKQTVDRISLSPNYNSKKGQGVGFGVICFLSLSTPGSGLCPGLPHWLNRKKTHCSRPHDHFWNFHLYPVISSRC